MFCMFAAFFTSKKDDLWAEFDANMTQAVVFLTAKD